jgi:hypothetical protein
MITASGYPANLPKHAAMTARADEQREFRGENGEPSWMTGGPRMLVRRWHNPDFVIVELLRRPTC